MKLKQQIVFTRPVSVFLLSLICTILWGSAFPSIKLSYNYFQILSTDTYSKLLLAGLRFFFAGMITLIICFIQSKKILLPNRRNIKSIFMISLIQTFLEYYFFYIAMSHTTGVKGSIINASASFFVVILSHFFYRDDKITPMKSLGCILGFCGIVLVSLNGSATLDFSFTVSGDGMMLLAAFSFAVGSLIGKNVSQTSDPMMVTGYQLSIGGIFLILSGFIPGGRLDHITPAGVFMLVYMTLVSAIAFTLWTILLKYNPMSRIAVYNFLTPVFGALLSAIFLGDSLLNITNLSALILVCLGIYFVNGIKKGFFAPRIRSHIIRWEDHPDPRKR